MSRLLKCILCIVLSLSFCFVTLGYSAITGKLVVRGTAKLEIPEGLFITAIAQKGNPTRLDVANAEFVHHSTTVKTSLSKSSNGSVTYTVTVKNNTKYDYAYRGLYYQSELEDYDNNYVSTSNGNSRIGVVTSFPNGRVVKAGESLRFEVTYTIGSSRNTFPASDTFYTMLNYQFGINVETAEEAIEAVHSKFQDILNTSSTYETLVEHLDDKFDGSQEWTSNYIGNVGNATTDDAMVVNTLFAGQLQIIINGVSTPARVIIKHENLDNNNMTGDDYVARNESNGGVFRGYGCEMTMYFTIDALSTPNGTAPVYVTVYTCDRDENGNISSEWYQIGDTYLGNAPIVSYNGTAGGTGSFVTDNWTSVGRTYSPTDQYSYAVDPNTSLKTLVQVTDDAAINEFQRLLNEAKEMIDDLTYAGTGIDQLERAYERAARYFTLDENGNPVAKQGTTRAQLCPTISDLDYAIVEAQKVIDSILGTE